MAGLLDDPTQQQYTTTGYGASDHGGIMGQSPLAAFFGAPGPANQPPPLTPQQIAQQAALAQAKAGTPLPQGFNPAMLGGGAMTGMPTPQGFTGGMGAGMPSPTMGFGGMPANPQASTGGLPSAAMGAVNAGLGLMQNSQPTTQGPAMPSMLGGGGTIPQPNAQHTAAIGPGGGGMGGGMINPQILKMLMGAGNGTA